MRTYRGDLGRKVDRLGNLHLASLKRALKVNVANLIAQIRLGADQPDEAVLDRQQDICALLDLLLDSPLCVDNQLLATIIMLAIHQSIP